MAELDAAALDQPEAHPRPARPQLTLLRDPSLILTAGRSDLPGPQLRGDPRATRPLQQREPRLRIVQGSAAARLPGLRRCSEQQQRESDQGSCAAPDPPTPFTVPRHQDRAYQLIARPAPLRDPTSFAFRARVRAT